MTSWLNKQGIKINKFDAVEDLIQDIRNRNTQAIKESGKTLWNKLETEQNDKLILDNKDNANELVMQELRSTFKPEFINRIDEIIIFNSLTKDVVYDILNKIIKDIEYRLRDKNIKINGKK